LQIGNQFVVSTLVDQYLNNQRTELLWDLLANPADKDELHVQNLQQLVREYPQSGLLHALLSYAGDSENLQHAAVYYDSKALYKLNKNIDALYTVEESQLLIIKDPKPFTGFFHAEVLAQDINHGISEAKPEELPALVPDAAFEAAQNPLTDTYYRIDVNAPAVVNEFAHTEADQPLHDLLQAEIKAESKTPPVEEDVFDEIVSIDDINLAVQEYYAAVMEPQAAQPLPYSDIYAEALKNEEEPATPIIPVPAQNIEASKEGTVFKDRKVDLTDEAEKLILNNIAATDFFIFEEALGEKKKTEEIKEEEPQSAVVEETSSVGEAAPIEEPNTIVSEEKIEQGLTPKPYEPISKYHDEKMPYSFMWWLDKTRKEHSGIYQPFVRFKPDVTQPITPAAPKAVQQQPVTDELQQQYIESIFQLNTIEELENGVEELPVFDTKKKEDEIIERFIHEVPQIKPQSADKIDNENKARKSSEDQDELVTETLAQIYTDQMLYPKAIDTYKKLMLKFPEKSAYFATQIEALQKK